MANDFEELGESVKKIVDDAIGSGDFSQLSEDIGRTISKAAATGSEALKKVTATVTSQDAYKQYRFKTPEEFQKKSKKEETPKLYKQTTADQTMGIFMTAMGGVIAFISAMMLSIQSTIRFLVTEGSGIGVSGVFSLILLAAGLFLAGKGLGTLGRVRRFKKYIKALKDKTYIDLKELKTATGVKLSVVKKDLKKMIEKDWFLQGHLSEDETTLMTSEETYQHYLDAEKQKAKREAEEAEKAKAQKNIFDHSGKDAAVQEILNKGNEYLQQIHEANEAIPGAVMTDKIARMEMIVDRIFDRLRNHPEAAPALKKLMNYYLPMTVKLLNAYRDMDQLPVQGENVASSKAEIEQTLDTLNLAFEKLLDSVFADTALDVSTDITVLETLLAQEGLTEEDF